MKYINNLELTSTSYQFQDKSAGYGNFLPNLSKLNIFIAPNNSGKSRLIRHFYSEPLSYKPDKSFINLKDVNGIIHKIKEVIRTNPDINEIKTKYGNLEEINIITEQGMLDLIDLIAKLNRDSDILIGQSSHSTGNVNHGILGTMLKMELANLEKCLDYKNLTELVQGYPMLKVYLPIMRSLHILNNTFNHDNPLSDLFLKKIEDGYQLTTPNINLDSNEDIFFKKINEEYHFTEDENNLVITGQKYWKILKDLLLGDMSERKLVEEYQRFLSQDIFDNQQVVLIPRDRKEDMYLYIKIGEEREQPIHFLGDGLQNIILSTLTAFLYPGRKKLFFIEEPEVWMHPGMQRRLINAWMTNPSFDNSQLFITTHSNHFLDVTLDHSDVSLYTITKNKQSETVPREEYLPNFTIIPLRYGDTSIVDDLGLRNSSVYLANCSIWVEGITDRLYIRKILELMDQENSKYIEDLHYTIIEYSGSNITHYFVDKDKIDTNPITGGNKLLLVVDGDSHNKQNGKRGELLYKILGERYYPLELKEVENLISKLVLIETIVEFIGENYRKELKTDFEEQEYHFIDSQNLKKNDFVRLPDFIRDTIMENIPEDIKNRITKKIGNSIEFADKVKFCRIAISNMKAMNDLSRYQIELGNRILKHIKDNNKI